MKRYILLLIAFLFLPILGFIFSRDASVYAYMGSLLFENKTPYIDGWDHKGITMYLINAFGYLLGFKHYLGIRILELIGIAYVSLHFYKTILLKYSKKQAFVAIAFGLFTLKYFFDGGNVTEEYGALSALFSLSLYMRKKQYFSTYIIIGALFVFNITIRANLIAFWIALFFALCMHAILKKEPIKELLKKLVGMGIGLVIYCLLLAIYFSITDSFSEFYGAAFTYNFSYSKQPLSSLVGAIIKSLRTYELSIIMILALVISAVSLIKKKSSFIELLLLIWIPIELVFSNMSGKMFAHYYIMWFPIIILSMLLIFKRFGKHFKEKEKQYIIIGVSVFFFFQIPIFKSLLDIKSTVLKKTSRNELIAKHIESTYSEKSLLVWGNECSIYNLTGKYAPVSNFYQTLFKLESPLTLDMIFKFNNEVRESLPELIVDTKTKSLLYLDGSNENEIAISQRRNLSEFVIFVSNNYTLKESIDGVDYYALNRE